MILRLLILVYAWVWGVEPWKPVTNDEWCAVAMSVVMLDTPAMIGVYALGGRCKDYEKKGDNNGK